MSSKNTANENRVAVDQTSSGPGSPKKLGRLLIAKFGSPAVLLLAAGVLLSVGLGALVSMIGGGQKLQSAQVAVASTQDDANDENLDPASPTTLSQVAELDSTTTTLYSANRSHCLMIYSTGEPASYSPNKPVGLAPAAPAEPVAETTTTSPEQTTSSETTAPATETSAATTSTQKPDPGPAPAGWADSGYGVHVPIELLVIRCCESRSNYQSQNGTSSASGAYQFLDSTWAGRYGLARAMHATPSQQDRAAVELWRARGSKPWNASKHCWARPGDV